MSVNSIGVKALVARIMDRYDRNNDGAINLKGNDGAFSVDDTSEKVVTNNSTYNDYPKIGDGRWHTWWTPYLKKDQIDLGSLFVAADTDKSGSATRDEVEALISSYDANKTGRLEADELNNLKSDFPEKTTQTKEADPWHWHSGSRFAQAGDYPETYDPKTDGRFNIPSLPSVYDLG